MKTLSLLYHTDRNRQVENEKGCTWVAELFRLSVGRYAALHCKDKEFCIVRTKSFAL